MAIRRVPTDASFQPPPLLRRASACSDCSSLCMATESEVKALARLDLPALRQDFDRLSVDDLSALASFPAEPHALIGRVVGVVHCLLLTLAPEHATLALSAPPWALLRLQLLADTSAIWKKLRKRIWQLETGAKTLAIAQIRFACEQFVPLLFPSQQHAPRLHDWQLERLAQVSTIAASLGAWVACCLCYSFLPSTSSSRRIGRALHCRDACTRAQLLPDPMPQPRSPSPSRRDPSNAAKTMGSRVTSRRAGLKLGSCFLLFHARLSERLDVVKNLVTVDLPDEWAVYRLDTNRLGRQSQHSATPSAWWKPFHPIDSTASRHLALSLLPPLAQQALLFQLGFHAHLFEPRMQIIPHAKLLPPTTPVFTLKFAIVAVSSRQQLSLLGIGSVLVTLGTTVAALRSQLAVSLASCLSNSFKPDSFRFLYRGSLLPQSQERHLEAMPLLPFALLVLVEDGDARNSAQPREFHIASQLWRFHDEVSRALVNAGVPNHLTSASTTEATQCFAMCQPLASSSTGPSAPTASTSSTIAEFFTHWRAFVRFQQLQDSVVFFQHSPKKKKAKLPRRHRLNGSRDRDSDQGGGDEEDEGVQQGPQLPRKVPSSPAHDICHGPQLPRQRFNSKKEWLQPLYALTTVVSATTAILKTPYPQDIEQALASSCRLVLGTEDHVVHVTRINGQASECDVNGVVLSTIHLSFQHDESSPLASLLGVQASYTWLILPHKPDSNRPSRPKWLCDLYRFVWHPVYDFQGLKQQRHHHFRVYVPCQLVERAVEARFWSRRLDWTPSLNATDLHDTLLRQIFDSLCHSHPPALAVDSVKFSNLLYEAHIQPSRLGIGDAAFLFASNLTPGSAYEMNFDGFVRAIEWLAQRFYSDSDVKGASRPKKTNIGVQSSPSKGQHTRLLSPLRRFCFETLVHLPSLQAVWHRLMDSWRRERKQQVLDTFALEYCAATRLQARWKRFITWKTYLEERQRMKNERLAATKLQSRVRGRQSHLNYVSIRQAARKVQLRVKARQELRCLRAERVAFLERMRLRLARWTRWQLQVLRTWKRGNPEQAARRERIREKRERRLGMAVFPLATRRLRFSLYRAKPGLPEDGTREPSDEDQMPSSWYELEVMDASRSWGQVLRVSQNQIDRLEAEELERIASQQQLRLTAPDCTREAERSRSSATSKESENQPKRDSVVYPTTKPNAIMLALARRLFVQEDVRRSSGIVRWYVNPTGTSLGTLVFKGVLHARDDHWKDGNDRSRRVVQYHIVRLLHWAAIFKIMAYSPATSSSCRFDLSASFLLHVLRFARFPGLRPLQSGLNEEDEAIEATPQAGGEQQPIALLAQPSEDEQCGYDRLRRILTGSQRLLALRCILSYVLRHGALQPTYEMMPHVIAERERRRNECDAAQHDARVGRERQLIVKVQTRVRQRLARRTRLQLALSAYSKQFDREHNRFIYVRHHLSGAVTLLGDRKPFSLFNQDVPLPPDEWQPIARLAAVEVDSTDSLRFVNPRRGVYSRFNDGLAARVIQRWFRRKMWAGINDWGLRDVVRALRYHRAVQKPTNVADPNQLDNLKRHALQLHVLEHQYKAAYAMYEAALKLAPQDVQTLVGLATLLIISCRYPAAQSWLRAVALLQQAHVLASSDLATALLETEENGFRWALFLQPKSPHAVANYAIYLQCVYHDFDKAELLYRRALDLDPADDQILTNYRRLQSERNPDGVYAFAGSGKFTLMRSTEVRRCGPGAHWREMEDSTARSPSPKRFFQDLRTGKCAWQLPENAQSVAATSESDVLDWQQQQTSKS